MSAYKTIELTEDHIKLLSAIKFERFVFDVKSMNGRIGWGVDQYSPWGGNYPIEDIALILGHFNDAIKGTESDILGRQFPKKLDDKFHDLYDDITENFDYMFDLLIYMSDKGGLKPGKYKCHKLYHDWEKID